MHSILQKGVTPDAEFKSSHMWYLLYPPVNK